METTAWRRTTTVQHAVQALWAPANMLGVRTSCSRRAVRGHLPRRASARRTATAAIADFCSTTASIMRTRIWCAFRYTTRWRASLPLNPSTYRGAGERTCSCVEECISECFCWRYSAFARLRQVRLPFSSGFSYRREWDGFRKEWIFLKKRIFCITKQGKKTREVTSPGPWPLIHNTTTVTTTTTAKKI